MIDDEPREVRNRVFDDDYDAKKRKRKSKQYERRVAKKLGGRRHALSGASDKDKGDFSTDLLLGEHKYTGKKSLSIKRDWLEKVAIEAIASRKTPVFAFTFTEWDQSVIVPKDWIAVPLEFLQELLRSKEDD